MKDPGNRLIIFSIIGIALFYFTLSKTFNNKKEDS